MTEYSAIILAGGESKRMGQKKSTLLLQGKTFIEIIIDKLIDIGISEILISGYEYDLEKYTDTGCVLKTVKDIYEKKGPLAGIHAGLEAAAHNSVLIVTEDAPLVPIDFMKQLMQEHEENDSSITVTRSGDRLQPLLGIYDKSLISECDDILQGDKATVRALIDRVGCSEVTFDGDEILIRGCNTPEEYELLRKHLS
ncbi:MAG: molybdenum cofactor guanylyltransferase [Eubacterium sp.]|nr:molybdenum cofactor guanylyltransferase [Eubacterium sp.]